MEIIKPSYEILTNLEAKEAARMMQHIEMAGRVCYKSEAKNYDMAPEITNAFIAKIIKRGHESVIEHEKITVRFIVDRGVTHEIVRHRLCSFSQESTRYCDYSKKGMQFILPPWVSEEVAKISGMSGQDVLMTEHFYGMGIGIPPNDLLWIKSMAVADANYSNMLDNGWPPQQARSVLPNSLKTEIVVTANLRQWREVFRQRCAPGALPQMREVMVPLLAELKTLLPVIFSDIGGF